MTAITDLAAKAVGMGPAPYYVNDENAPELAAEVPKTQTLEELRDLLRRAVDILKGVEPMPVCDPPQACIECGGPLQWRCPACRIAQSPAVADGPAHELGPLPEPPAFYCYQFQSYYGLVWRTSPNDWNGSRPIATEGVYTADQVVAERERCFALGRAYAAQEVAAATAKLRARVDELTQQLDRQNLLAQRQNKLMHMASHDAVLFGGFTYDPNEREFKVPPPTVLCNDFFAPAADCEELPPDCIDELHDAFTRFGRAGVMAWVSLRRGGKEPWRLKPDTAYHQEFNTAREALKKEASADR